MSDDLYPDVDPAGLGRHYTAHMEAMTTHGLTSKAAIAAQLALRDATIDGLQRRHNAMLVKFRDCSWRHVVMGGVRLLNEDDVFTTLRQMGLDVDTITLVEAGGSGR